MRIEYLKVENFKCFEEFEIELEKDSKVNIIFGINGVGKTSILKALSVAVGSFFLEMSEVEKRNMGNEEVRMAMLHNMLEYQFPVKFQVKGTVLNTPFDIIRTMNSFSGGLTQIHAKEITKLSSQAVEVTRNGQEVILPVIAYFSSKRLFVDRKSSSKDKKPLGRLIGYFNALNDSSIKNEIEEWLGNQEEIKLTHLSNGDMTYKDDGLMVLYNTLSNIFPDQYQVVKYFRPKKDDRYPSGIFFKEVHTGNWVPLQTMSDGYQNIYKLVLEIAWRCYVLNPFLKGNVIQQTPGVVLIDEIDLHLHPQLQEQIINILHRCFPLVQFIVTTHSPLVLASSKADVFVLEYLSSRKYLSVNKINQSIFRLYNRQIIFEVGIIKRRTDTKARKFTSSCISHD